MGSVNDFFLQGWQHHQAGRMAQAEHLYRQALLAEPAYADAWCFLGVVCQAQGRLAEAEVNYRRALLHLPNHPSAANCLGIVLALQGRLEDSARVFENLVKQPKADPEAFNNFALVQYKLERYDEAMALCRRALELRPDFAGAFNNMGNVLADRMQLDEALALYDKALALQPSFPECRWNRATLLLVQGKFKEGWSEYESRWHQPGFALPPYHQPRWDGSALNGKTILLWGEQGIGDTLQFVRYAQLVKQRGGRVLVACQPALQQLLVGGLGIDGVVAKDAAPPAFDVYSPLLSLPGLLGTNLANVPAAVPYLKVEDGLVRHWHEQLGHHSGLRIGIAWQGSVTHRKDRHRSLPLSLFADLARRPGVQLVSLQKGRGTDQLRALAGQLPVLDLESRLGNDSESLVNIAAIMKSLDLVISCDTAIAHLAGSLAVPVWVAIPFAPDWRWLLDRDDTPWYPTMRLFRQTRPGDWLAVFERMAQEIKG